MFSTPEFWVCIAFFLFLGAAGKKAYLFLTATLDEHRQKVTQQLEEAQRLHDEALSLLNSYKKKYEEALEQAEKIISFAEAEAQEFKKASEQEFENFIKQKENLLLGRIANETEEAKAKLKDQVADEALKIVERLILKEIKEKKKLTTAALKEVMHVSLNSKSPKNTQL
ncbi:MAG: ATP synthase F0 subunit B [Proteobacteria bacterium]|nr:ATP synthase F0 subunit B [Pseudomonadota bacterium]